MSNYTLSHMDLSAPRSELHDLLKLTGAEISCNNLPAGVSVPFVHSHTLNEEIYIVLEGAGVTAVCRGDSVGQPDINGTLAHNTSL